MKKEALELVDKVASQKQANIDDSDHNITNEIVLTFERFVAECKACQSQLMVAFIEIN